jgi:hypothetical protein
LRQKIEGWLLGAVGMEEMGSLMDIEFSFWKMKRILEIDVGDNCITL